ncbi:MAG: tagaturonate epimerase family protein [bacterium]
MEAIAALLLKNDCFKLDGPLPQSARDEIAKADPAIYTDSACALGGQVYMLKKIPRGRRLLAFATGGSEPAPGFSGDSASLSGGITAKICDTEHANSLLLRDLFPFTRPMTLDLKTSFGMGDRIGNATPGHIRASKGYDFAPILPQQSIREMTRTGRSPENVMDDACWAVFQCGYRRPFGADADHLKTEDDVRSTFAAGFTFFTIDPSDQLNFDADNMPEEEIDKAFDALFKNVKDKESLLERYSRKLEIADPETGLKAVFSTEPYTVRRIAVKFLQAIRHTVRMYRILLDLAGSADRFDFEMSVDETPKPTTLFEHLFVALELKRKGVTLQSLAPRFPGEFQKGIDYIGDADTFKATLERHALIARHYGPYKLSIHSGSDKFSIFPIVGEVTRGLFHEKTAGTSYLEAMRVVARKAPALYREIHAFALSRFEEDRASYHVTTKLSAIPDVNKIADDHLEFLFDAIDSRQLIHITYGSALTQRGEDGKLVFYDRIMDVLDEFEEDYYNGLASHFERHIKSLGIPPLK